LSFGVVKAAGNSSPSEKCLEVDGFVRSYSAEAKVGPISFSVKEGEFFSLLGPSGCGKSTTLRAIAGFESVDEGEIRLNGRAIHNVPPNKRGIGLVFQRHALFPHLTVRDNIAFGLRQHRVARDLTEQRCRAGIELVGLKGFEDRFPAQLSGGQQQRVALARSLVLEPPLLLLDEPMSSLDLKLRVQMREELRALQKRLRKTTIFVTHDQTEALAMSDRIAVLSNGHIEQIGTPWEIYNRPATRFVASFIGRSNQIEVASCDLRAGRPIMIAQNGFALALGDKVAVPAGGSLAIIRPESVRLAPEPDQSGPNSFEVKVLDQEYLGEDIQFRVITISGTELFSTRKATASDRTDRVGTTCYASIDPDNIYVIC
jgi:ABC-type Fe3+/spermidine/putrescine transport system ATPase subunit